MHVSPCIVHVKCGFEGKKIESQPHKSLCIYLGGA